MRSTELELPSSYSLWGTNVSEPSVSNVPNSGRAGICTLFEGDYHLGLAAFVNSLVRAGYSGRVWAGYKGALPPWIDQIHKLDESGREYVVADQIRLVFLPIEVEMHLTNYKPQFMLDLLANHARDIEYLWYFDPDIWIRAKWSFFADWQHYGIALCQEIVDNLLPADAPLRQRWRNLAAGIGFLNPQPLHHYFNGGMVGVPAAHADFLEAWKNLIELAAATGVDLSGPPPGTRESPFYGRDQDALNIAAMYSKHPLSTLGPQGMGFIHGGIMMYHAVGQKPWRGSFLIRALKGDPPSGAMKFFLAVAASPIRAYSPMQLRAKRLACAMAAFLGRFYRRR
jgi:hypothetical protein